MKKIITSALLCLTSTFAQANSTTDVVCSYAPSQFDEVKKLSVSIGGAGAVGGTGVLGGAGAMASAIAQEIGLTAVRHSSGAYIFTGSNGYIAGTLGGVGANAAAATAAAVPVIISATVVAGTIVGTVELLCAPKNHPEFTAKVKEASEEFVRRSKTNLSDAKDKIVEVNESSKPVVSKVNVVLRDTASNVFNYAYRNVINSEFK